MGSGLFGCYDVVLERALTVAPILWIFCGWARWLFVAQRDHCTDTVISEPDTAVNCWSA